MVMKKFVLILAVLGIFVIYSAGIRHQVPVLKKPQSLIASSSPPPTTKSGSTISSTGSSAAPQHASSGRYKDGTYTGSVADAYYGNVQVAVTISGGRIAKVKFLQFPNTHSTSVIINDQAIPYLQQEAIQAQSSNIQLITGATFTSQAFAQSLQAALSRA